ncbi:hypothetical protein RZS08_06350, partial [Arthrospira platensis SPKY1]|nr:hypothetical protein [Arthrospira platensis SPKY1]
MLREVAYESVLLRERPLYHRQAARWLAAQSGDRLDEYAALIAEHYELAGEAQPAAEMYARAADRAADLHQPDEAILYYRKVLAFLAHKPHLAAWQLRVQERLGALLWRQARLAEALQNDLAFLSVAKQDGDLLRQARAWNRLAALYEARSDPAEMLNCAVQAEQAAWLIGADTALLEALLAQGRARLALGQFAAARETAERAEALAARLGTPATGRALDLLCAVHRQASREAEARRCLARLAGLA